MSVDHTSIDEENLFANKEVDRCLEKITKLQELIQQEEVKLFAHLEAADNPPVVLS